MRTLVYGMAIAAALSLQSCDGAARLAGDVAGPWTGAPESFYDDATSNATIVETYDFTLSDDKSNNTGGPLILTALLGADGQLPGNDDAAKPYEINVSAKATANGNWKAIDDDEILITIDSKSINVTVDPDAVVVSSESETGESVPAIGIVTAKMIRGIQTQFAQALKIRYLAPIKMDDIKIDGNVMTYEINDLTYTMQR